MDLVRDQVGFKLLEQSTPMKSVAYVSKQIISVDEAASETNVKSNITDCFLCTARGACTTV